MMEEDHTRRMKNKRGERSRERTEDRERERVMNKCFQHIHNQMQRARRQRSDSQLQTEIQTFSAAYAHTQVHAPTCVHLGRRRDVVLQRCHTQWKAAMGNIPMVTSSTCSRDLQLKVATAINSESNLNAELIATCEG